MSAVLSLSFGQADIVSALSACSVAELDARNIGVIGIDAEGLFRP